MRKTSELFFGVILMVVGYWVTSFNGIYGVLGSGIAGAGIGLVLHATVLRRKNSSKT